MRNTVYGIIILFSMALSASADEFVASGTVNYNNSVWGSYAVYNGSRGPWMRIWHQGNYVLTAGFDNASDGWANLSWMNYQTNGYHWTLRGGRDTTAYWNLKNTGAFAFPMSSPATLSAFLTGGGSGFMRTTHHTRGPRTQIKYYPINDSWRQITFVPSSVNAGAAARLVAMVTGQRTVASGRANNRANTTSVRRTNTGTGVNLLGISSGGVSY